MGSRAGFIALLGAPNAGKSTLFNRLLGTALAGVTPKPQTTRFLIMGILQHELGQAVLIDTPGLISHPRNAWHQALNRHSQQAARKADVLLYLIALRSAAHPTDIELEGQEWLRTLEKPLFVGFTHADEMKRASRAARLNEVARAVAPLKARGPYDVSLDQPMEGLLTNLLEALPEGPPLYPTDELTPQPLRFFVAEVLRKHLYLLLREELPYGMEVEIVTYRETTERDYISATLYVEKESHKPMVIGRNGAMIKKIGTLARKEIEELVGKPVYLELFVKVAPEWRRSILRLRSLGYEVSQRDTGRP